MKNTQNGTRTIEEGPVDYRIPVYIELIASYNWTLDQVDANYLEQVKLELGITE